ncbi:serine/threonine protein kinase [Dethiobacter alkaliphilus AHT 1]|uniref:Serine/threonine protein kinase n=1 Tax=Dethiobacter alkaliphilus AHT 1 TaxID=555088 RepID=C0GES7_DETAL|nr:serine/threonine protein kinase [Dethiobacter alkaliphilus AHT 1]
MNIKGAEKEVDIMRNYGQHPALPKLYDYFTFKHRAYIIMEYIDGEPLGRGRKVKKKNEKDALEITVNVLRALGHLHKHNILHGDTLPKNVMTLKGQQNSIKIIDFGFSFKKGKAGVFKGKKWFGKVTGKPIELREQFLLLDDTTDIYVAAFLCVSLLNGHQPQWDEKDGRHIFNLENSRLQAIMEKAMSKEKAFRYSTTEAFIYALEQS